MTDRTILLVVHTGRDEVAETARRVEKVLGDKGIGLRVLSAEAVDRGHIHMASDDMHRLGAPHPGRVVCGVGVRPSAQLPDVRHEYELRHRSRTV